MFNNFARAAVVLTLIACPVFSVRADTLDVSCRSEEDGNLSASLVSKVSPGGSLIFQGSLGTIQDGSIPVSIFLNIKKERLAGGIRRFVIHTLNLNAESNGSDVAFAQISDYIPANQQRKFARFNLTFGGLGILDPEGLSCSFELNSPVTSTLRLK